MQNQPIKYQLPGIPPIRMIPFPAGTFIMGDGSRKNNPAHEVYLDNFYLCEFPVTQDLYQAIAKNNPSEFKGKRHPVENVNWYDAVEFCNLLCEKLRLKKAYTIDKEAKDKNNKSGFDKIKWAVKPDNKTNCFRLPTEAEWEFAAKLYFNGDIGGTNAGSNRLEQIGWFRDNNGKETREVGLKIPNQSGIYDMSGNVDEWCWDWYSDYNQKDIDNPTGPETGSRRIIRGGSWSSDRYYCHVVNRYWFNANLRVSFIGFRLALSL